MSEPMTMTMTPEQWIGALEAAWWLGHFDVCTDCNCPPDRSPYHLKESK